MAKLTINREVAGANSGAKFLSKMRPVTDINTNSELAARFKIDQKVLDSIIKSINNSGYDTSEPIILWKEEDVVVDGHTRLEAAKQVGIEEVPVVEKSFKNLEEALAYTVHRQYDRRNLSQAEIYELAINLDEVEEKTGEGRATERLAEKIGVSSSTIQHARTVEKKAPEEIKDKIKNNEMTINQAYQTVRQKKEKDNFTDYDNSVEIDKPNYPIIADEIPISSSNEKIENETSITEDISSIIAEEIIEKRSLFEKIISFNITELATYLSTLQKTEFHTESEWEEILLEEDK